MTTVAFLLAGSLVITGLVLAMSWDEQRAHMRMLREVARIKHRERQKLRSRTPVGSGSAPDNATRPPGVVCLSGRRVKVERYPAVGAPAPPVDAATKLAGGCVDPHTSTGAAGPRNPAPVGLHPAYMWMDRWQP